MAFVAPSGSEPMELATNHSQGLAGLTFGALLTNTNNCRQTGPPGRLRFGANLRVRLVMIGASFRMTNDDGASACVCQHLSRNIASMRP